VNTSSVLPKQDNFLPDVVSLFGVMVCNFATLTIKLFSNFLQRSINKNLKWAYEWFLHFWCAIHVAEQMQKFRCTKSWVNMNRWIKYQQLE